MPGDTPSWQLFSSGMPWPTKAWATQRSSGWTTCNALPGQHWQQKRHFNGYTMIYHWSYPPVGKTKGKHLHIFYDILFCWMKSMSKALNQDLELNKFAVIMNSELICLNIWYVFWSFFSNKCQPPRGLMDSQVEAPRFPFGPSGRELLWGSANFSSFNRGWFLCVANRSDRQITGGVLRKLQAGKRIWNLMWQANRALSAMIY